MQLITACLFTFLIFALIANIRRACLNSRHAYVKALCDLNDRISEIVEAGLKKNESMEGSDEEYTLDELGDMILIAALTGVICEINKECMLTKALPFRYIPNPDQKIYKKFHKYLPLLNDGHKKFLA